MNRGGARWRPGSDFNKMWAGQTVSEMGTQVSALAIPLIAIDRLHAGVLAVGVLTAALTAPFLLALPAGAYVDRWDKRRVMILADVGRAIVLATVPVAAVAGLLSMAQLVVVALVAGGLSVFFDVAYQSWVPELVGSEDLLAANGRLGATVSLATGGGPALGGVLVGTLGAAVAVAADAGSFVVSVVSLLAVRRRQVVDLARLSQGPPRSLAAEVAEGVRFVWGEHRIRTLAAATTTLNLFESLLQAVLLLWLRRHLHLSATHIGVLLVLGTLGGFLGAAVAARVAAWVGLGRAMIAGCVLAGVGNAAYPLTTRHDVDVVVVAGQALSTFGCMVFTVNQLSLRQTLCPPALLGRMQATLRMAIYGALPVGALGGGLIGSTLGLRPALWVAAAGGATSAVWILASPLRRVQEMPTGATDQLPAPDALVD